MKYNLKKLKIKEEEPKKIIKYKPIIIFFTILLIAFPLTLYFRPNNSIFGYLANEYPANLNPFSITNNKQLISIASKNNWIGNGTEDNPIIIEGHTINTLNSDWGMSFRNTDLHLVIRNCIIYSTTVQNYALYFYNAKNIIVENNTIFDFEKSIYLTRSKNVSIKNNTLINAVGYGIYLDTSSNIIIEANIISTTAKDGFRFVKSNDNSIILNEIEAKIGATLSYSNRNLFSNNSFTNSVIGIHISETSNFNNITYNDFYDCNLILYESEGLSNLDFENRLIIIEEDPIEEPIEEEPIEEEPIEEEPIEEPIEEEPIEEEPINNLFLFGSIGVLFVFGVILVKFNKKE